MRKIPLTQGKVALVDDEDYEILSKYNWIATFHRRTWYAIRLEHTGELYENGRPKRTKIRMHRQILNYPDGEIDHKDNNGTNNQKCNLRICTTSQNRANSLPQDRNKYGLKGVRKNGRKYSAIIGYRNKRIVIGTFDDIKIAARAYDTMSRFLFGEYANLNYPDLPRIDIVSYKRYRYLGNIIIRRICHGKKKWEVTKRLNSGKMLRKRFYRYNDAATYKNKIKNYFNRSIV